MLRLSILALALMASGLVAAPAPVYRPSKAPKTPFEVMLDGLRKTGEATGTNLTRTEIWTLTAEKVEGKRLTTVVLTYVHRSGKVNPVVYTARGASIKAIEGKKGVFFLELYKVEANLGSQSMFIQSCERELELSPKRQ